MLFLAVIEQCPSYCAETALDRFLAREYASDARIANLKRLAPPEHA
jgi:hypothetical protein